MARSDEAASVQDSECCVRGGVGPAAQLLQQQPMFFTIPMDNDRELLQVVQSQARAVVPVVPRDAEQHSHNGIPYGPAAAARDSRYHTQFSDAWPSRGCGQPAVCDPQDADQVIVRESIGDHRGQALQRPPKPVVRALRASLH